MSASKGRRTKAQARGKRREGKTPPLKSPALLSIEQKALEAKNWKADVERRLANLDERLLANEVRSRELVGANNAASALLASVERFLDKKFGDGWDEGIREQVEKQKNMLSERRQLYVKAARKEMPAEERLEIADKLLAISQEAGTFEDDVTMIVHQYSRARAIEKIREVSKIIAEKKTKITPQLAALFVKFEEHVKKREKAPADPPQLESVPPEGE